MISWRFTGLGILIPLLSISQGRLAAQVNVWTYHNNLARTGANTNETLLTLKNVEAATFGKLFAYTVDGDVYAQPLYMSGVVIDGQAHNVLFVATEHNSVYAFDADNPAGPEGGLLWHVNLGPSAATPNPDFGNRFGGFVEIQPEVGITGTPVIDIGSGTLYVDAFTHEGSAYAHRIHALNITNGTERPFSPVLVTASVPGAGVGGANGIVTFDPKQQLQRSALTLAGGKVYLAYASYAVTDPYHGWVLGYDASTLELSSDYIFNSTPNGTIAEFGPHAGEGGIWMGGGGIAVDESGDLYFATGNGPFNAFKGSGGTEYGDTLLRLTTSGRLNVADYFTPYNFQALADNDIDLGSGGVMLLPEQPGPFPHLLVCSGKEGKMYVVNRSQMTSDNNHVNTFGTVDKVVQTFSIVNGSFGTPAWFNGRIYHAARSRPLVSLQITNGVFDIASASTGPRTFGFPGATPSVSANGNANGIVWAIQRASGFPAVLAAYDASDLTTELYNSAQAENRDQLPEGIKFAVPTIANGKVFVGTKGAVSVFSLLQSPYELWKSYHFDASASEPIVAGDTTDPDNDGIMNIFEYALGGDPNVQQNSPPISGSLNAAVFELRFSRNLIANDIGLTVQRAASVEGPWINAASYAKSTGWVTNLETVNVTETSAAGAPPDQRAAVLVSEPFGDTAFFRVMVNH